jgi:hypothetical protein
LKCTCLAHEFDKEGRLTYTPLLPVSSTQSLVAQSAERSAVNRNVVGSSPTRGARLIIGKRETLGSYSLPRVSRFSQAMRQKLQQLCPRASAVYLITHNYLHFAYTPGAQLMI